MPWCPICKNEYRNGFTVCKDCNVPLVDEMPVDVNMAEVVILESQVLAERLVSYLDYEIGEGAIAEELPDHTWRVSIDGKHLKKAKRCFEAFYTVEWEEFMKQELAKQLENSQNSNKSDDEELEYDDNEDPNDEDPGDDDASTETEQFQTNTPSDIYVKKADQKKDMTYTATAFYTIGILGIIFLVLNFLGYFPMFDSMISYLVITFMSFGCVLVGFSASIRAKKAASEINEEELLSQQITAWLDANLTSSQLKEQRSPELSKEANFFNEIEYLKSRITEQFGELDLIYLEYIAEEYYNEHFGY